MWNILCNALFGPSRLKLHLLEFSAVAEPNDREQKAMSVVMLAFIRYSLSISFNERLQIFRKLIKLPHEKFREDPNKIAALIVQNIGEKIIDHQGKRWLLKFIKFAIVFISSRSL